MEQEVSPLTAIITASAIAGTVPTVFILAGLFSVAKHIVHVWRQPTNNNASVHQPSTIPSGLEAYLPHAPNFQRYLQGMGQLTVNEDTSAGIPSTGWHRREFMVSINGQEWGDYWFHADGRQLLTQGYTSTLEIKGNPSLLRMNHVKDERGDIYRDVPFP
jgi:hypothetical protein